MISPPSLHGYCYGHWTAAHARYTRVTQTRVSRGVRAAAVLRAGDVALHTRALVEVAVEERVVCARVRVGRRAAQEEGVLAAGCVEDTGGALGEDVLHGEVDPADRDPEPEEQVEGVPG